MKFLVLFIAIIITGCASTQRQPPTIVADGTEAKQFENLFLCGDSKGFTKALGDVGKKLSKAWDTIEGSDSPDECTVRITIDATGEIVDHKVVTCDKPSAISKVLSTASPVPTPVNQCMQRNINGVKFSLNSSNKDS